MLSLSKLLEEAFLLYEKLEPSQHPEALTLKQFAAEQSCEDLIAERIIEWKTQHETNPEMSPALKILMQILFVSARAFRKQCSAENAREEIEKRFQQFQHCFKHASDAGFVLKIYDFLYGLRITGFQGFIKQISAENAELNAEISKLNTHLNTAKSSLEKFQKAYEFDTKEKTFNPFSALLPKELEMNFS